MQLTRKLRKICPQSSDIKYNNRPMPPCQPKFSVSYMIVSYMISLCLRCQPGRILPVLHGSMTSRLR